MQTASHNQDQTSTRHELTLRGYTLTIVKYADRPNHVTIASPLGAPALHVNDYYDVPAVAVNWAAVGNVNPDEAREQAAQIVAAAKVADHFQDVINIVN